MGQGGRCLLMVICYLHEGGHSTEPFPCCPSFLHIAHMKNYNSGGQVDLPTPVVPSQNETPDLELRIAARRMHCANTPTH